VREGRERPRCFRVINYLSPEIGEAKRHKYWQTTTINMTGLTINVEQVRAALQTDCRRYSSKHNYSSALDALGDNANCFVNSLILPDSAHQGAVKCSKAYNDKLSQSCSRASKVAMNSFQIFLKARKYEISALFNRNPMRVLLLITGGC